MKAMIVYDSMFGNTKVIAEAIGNALGPQEDVAIVQASEAKPEQLEGLTLLIVGSPTQRFSPTGATTSFLKSIPKKGLEGVKVAAFDTRFPESKIDEIGILAFFVRIFGYAAQPIADRLEKKGGELAIPPEGFCVGDTEGPLLEGELERVADWAKQITATQ
jgi:flavodoxin